MPCRRWQLFLFWLHIQIKAGIQAVMQLSAAERSLPVTAVLGRYRHQSSKRTIVQNKKDPILGKLYATPT
jgi:hypothetical protein